jgi:hypothetical protein
VVWLVCVETKVRLARWVSKVFLVSLGALVPWVSKVPSVLSELLGQSVFVVSKVKLVNKEFVVHLEPLVLLVQLVSVVRLETKVSKVSKDPLELREILALKV